MSSILFRVFGKRLPILILSSFFLLSLAHCGKPRLFGQDMKGETVVKAFPVDAGLTFKSVKEALVIRGYNLQNENAQEGALETHWQPTTSDSHYVDMFNRQDRGTVGAYYKLVVKVKPQGNQSEVEIYSLAKSIISNLKSTGIEEEKVLDKVADFTRKSNIEVTNVGIQ